MPGLVFSCLAVNVGDATILLIAVASASRGATIVWSGASGADILILEQTGWAGFYRLVYP